MMRSMYAAVTGLRTHQTKMDVIGNNIANVNTPGFKKSSVTFQDIFYQTLRGGSRGTADQGGTNPQQIGLGVSLGSVNVIHTQGSSQATGNSTDLMIQGDGYFVLTDGNKTFYTRTGAFTFDVADTGEKRLVQVGTGLRVINTDGGDVVMPQDASSFSFSSAGRLNYIDGQGVPVTDGPVVGIAKFPNPGGLVQVGQNLYLWDQAAGDEVGGSSGGDPTALGAPGTTGRGTIIPSTLEMANVELAQEFTEMITAQRGFQANARVITTSDEMLQELANLKR